MSALIPNSNDKFFFLLNEAIIKNTVRPRPNELEKMTVSKVIRCSPEIEGDSQLGILLFCGIAHVQYGVSKNKIMDYIGVEPEEFRFKIDKFKKNLDEANKLPKLHANVIDVLGPHQLDLYKLKNKVTLINNYIKFHIKNHNVLYRKTGDV